MHLDYLLSLSRHEMTRTGDHCEGKFKHVKSSASRKYNEMVQAKGHRADNFTDYELKLANFLVARVECNEEGLISISFFFCKFHLHNYKIIFNILIYLKTGAMSF